MTGCNQSGHEIDGKVRYAAMACMLKLQQMLALVKHSFYDRPPLEQQLLVQQPLAVGHVPLDVRDEPKLPRAQQFTRQCL